MNDGARREPDPATLLAPGRAATVGRLATAARSASVDTDAAALVQMLLGESVAALEAMGGVLAIVRDGVPRPVLVHGGDGFVAADGAALTLEWVLPLAAAAATGEAVWIADRLEGLRRFPEWDTFETTAAAVALPLLVDGLVVGVLGYVYAEPHRAGPLERRHLQLVADCIVRVIDADAAAALVAGAGRAGETVTADVMWIPDLAAAEVAILDGDGVIVEVNDAWRAFGAGNGADAGRCGVGMSYLGVCDAAAGDLAAATAGAAIRAALAGTPVVGPIPIPCHAPDQCRWYEVMVSTRRSDTAPDRILGATVVLVPTRPQRREG